ncbi:hypothetical protein [Photobacterium carnosum]|uniref:hypothetical protein n=1 Tax=Photobacterium carnosum TaxID=2023717 RepID=UPI001E4F7291|nr:hypothetical protein [Photobacterium carnosum]MCD9539151.1 hypothetical protein [Photobacterium carnosum]MCF2163639.1 hypothetical protein [Photobacterium carnosum]
MSKNFKVAGLSSISRAVKIFIAPITLLVISKKLSSEELAFYYTFFSLISMQQLAELGIGHVIKQYISHAYILDLDGNITNNAKKEIKGFYQLSKFWFDGVALFLLIVVGISGYYYLSLSNSNINWNIPWVLLVFSTAISTRIMPIQLLLDGTQNQVIIQKVNIYSSIINSVVLCFMLYIGCGLYSISIAIFLSFIMMYIMMVKSSVFFNIKKEILEYDIFIDLKKIFSDVFPLLSKVSIVWALGFIFWNSFNFISFSLLNIDDAGKIIFAIALAKAGFGISESLTQGQSTIFSNLIGNKKEVEARVIFKKYFKVSIIVLLIGYISFFIFWNIFPDFYIFNKLPNKLIVSQIFLFHFILLYMIIINNFIRCYKIEPFIKQSISMSVFLPVIYYISLKIDVNYAFLSSSILIVIVYFSAKKIHKRYKI